MANTPNRELMIYVIAGEPSGDILGARLMDALRQVTTYKITFYGIGGKEMFKRGFNSLFPMTEIALMGISEVLPHLPKLVSRINETVRHIKTSQPDAVVTIDSPSFCNRVAKKLKGTKIPIIHYVAPSVWAWKSWRAKHMSSYLDKILALLHFEPPYFEEHGLPCEFVGHPVIESGADMGSALKFRETFQIGAKRQLLGVIPGSRKGEVARHIPIIQKALAMSGISFSNTDLVVPLASDVSQIVQVAMKDWDFNVHFVNENSKYDAFAALDAAVAASGTVALELALAKVPFVTIYRMSALSNYLARRIVRIKYVNLINILLDKPVVTELILENCTPKLIASALTEIWSNGKMRDQQIVQFGNVLALLGAGHETPSIRAARAVLDVLEQPVKMLPGRDSLEHRK